MCVCVCVYVYVYVYVHGIISPSKYYKTITFICWITIIQIILWQRHFYDKNDFDSNVNKNDNNNIVNSNSTYNEDNNDNKNKDNFSSYI